MSFSTLIETGIPSLKLLNIFVQFALCEYTVGTCNHYLNERQKNGKDS